MHNKIMAALAALFLALSTVLAYAITQNFTVTVTITGVPTAISLSTTSVNFPTTANANGFVATIAVAASSGTYSGPVTLGGADAANFALSSSVYPANLIIGSANVPTGTYHISITAAPVTTNFTISVTVPVATGISLSTTSVTFPSATNANANVATITVAATGGTYVGPVTLGGADAAKFALSSSTYPANLLIGSSNLAAGTYNISITAAPVTTPFTITVTVSTLTQVFNCSGFGATNPCKVFFTNAGSDNGAQFILVGAFNGSQPALAGSAVNLVPINSTHVANNINWRTAAVNVGQFSTTFTFVPDGQNVSFVLSNNTNTGSAQTATNGNFTAGAGCEGAFWQGTPGYPNNTFAVMLDSYGGNTAGLGTFTFSNVQYYDTGHDPPNAPNAPGRDPCNPDQGGTNFGLPWSYIPVNKISTSPVALNSPSGTLNTTTGDIYSATITYDGSNLHICLFDVTAANGSCTSGTTGTGVFFTNTWTGVNIPAIVGGPTAWVGVAGSTGLAAVAPLLINTFSYSSN